jgi:hypothetical protein
MYGYIFPIHGYSHYIQILKYVCSFGSRAAWSLVFNLSEIDILKFQKIGE